MLRLNKKQLRMIGDDNFFDVTSNDVHSLLLHMAQLRRPRDDIIKMRVKYDLWIDDREKRFMEKHGLSYDTHNISRIPAHRRSSSSLTCVGGPRFYIDGYTEEEWQMLTDEDYVPAMRRLSAFKRRCEKNGNAEALAILTDKYEVRFKERDGKYLESNGISPNAQYQEITRNTIDGMSYYRWKLLKQDDFVPPRRGRLISTIKKLRDEGYAEDAEAIEEKYLTFLYPDFYDTVTPDEIQNAAMYFALLHKKKPDAE